MTVVSGRGAGAVLALGSASWLSTFVFDRVGTGVGTRVALVSSWQEWTGLTVLAFLIVLIGKAMLERALADAGGEQAIPPDLLLPVAALVVLLLPYLPVVADKVPALDALAGPGRRWVWAVVGMQIAWAMGALVAPATASWPRSLSGPAGLAPVFTASLAICAGAAYRLKDLPLPSFFVVVLAAIAATTAWGWARRETGSGAAATFGWLAVVTSAPFVLHSFAILPDCAAALALIVGVRTLDAPRHPFPDALLRGVALAALPWLGMQYAPMSLAALILVAWRLRGRRAALVTPYLAATALWLGSLTYGWVQSMSLGTPGVGIAGVFADQERGALASAPVLALAAVGFWRLWRRDHAGRALAITTVAPLIVLGLTTGAFEVWRGGTATPGRDLVAALPLLVVPLAWAWHTSAPAPVERAALEWLCAVGGVITATLVFVHGGLLIANGRDGAAALLEYLDPARHLAAAVPSYVADHANLTRPVGLTILWLAIAAIAWRVASAIGPRSRGAAQLAASAIGATSLMIGAVAAPVFGSTDRFTMPVESQASADLLDRYDAHARPLAIIYSPFQLAAPDAALAGVVFAVGPEVRSAPQPLRMMFNARLSLPAGRYRVTATPTAGQHLSGELGVQVGRRGPALTVWTLADGTTWSGEFVLDVDAAFVGFVAAADVEARILHLDVTPVDIVGRGDRTMRPPVIAAARYGAITMYFHDDRTYLEPNGFWTKGRTRVELTLARADAASPLTGVNLRLQAGSHDAAPVMLTTPAWRGRVMVPPGEHMDVRVPWRSEVRLLPVALTIDSVFVPADEGGNPGDRRSLGCFVQVIDAHDTTVPPHAEVR